MPPLHTCGPTAHRGAFSDSASRTFCRLGPTAHRSVWRCRRMLLPALGLPCFRTPRADVVGEPMLEAPRKIRANRREKRVLRGTTTGAVEHSRAMPPEGGGGRNRHQSARKVAVQPDIPGGDAVADKRRSERRDALSVGTYLSCGRRQTLLRHPQSSKLWVATSAPPETRRPNQPRRAAL